MSDSVRPYGLYSARLLCPWDSPGKNTGVGCCALPQGVFLTQGSNPCLWRLLHRQADSLPLEASYPALFHSSCRGLRAITWSFRMTHCSILDAIKSNISGILLWVIINSLTVITIMLIQLGLQWDEISFPNSYCYISMVREITNLSPSDQLVIYIGINLYVINVIKYLAECVHESFLRSRVG